jgi:hypothetical protein
MRAKLPLDEAMRHATRVMTGRRALVAHIGNTGILWWGGHIDNWHFDLNLFSSETALKEYRHFIDNFKKGQTRKAHLLTFHKDGSFSTIMLGVDSKQEAQQFLADSLEEIRIRAST